MENKDKNNKPFWICDNYPDCFWRTDKDPHKAELKATDGAVPPPPKPKAQPKKAAASSATPKPSIPHNQYTQNLRNYWGNNHNNKVVSAISNTFKNKILSRTENYFYNDLLDAGDFNTHKGYLTVEAEKKIKMIKKGLNPDVLAEFLDITDYMKNDNLYKRNTKAVKNYLKVLPEQVRRTFDVESKYSNHEIPLYDRAGNKTHTIKLDKISDKDRKMGIFNILPMSKEPALNITVTKVNQNSRWSSGDVIDNAEWSFNSEIIAVQKASRSKNGSNGYYLRAFNKGGADLLLSFIYYLIDTEGTKTIQVL